MKSITKVIPVVLLVQIPILCYAGNTATLTVTARIVRQCTAITNDTSDCSPETLQFQSTLAGSANIITNGDEPSIRFVGPQPVVERERNTLNVTF